MIYTVTLNPCLDYLVAVPDFRSGRVNRAGYESLMPGGKGINVAYALHILKEPSLALGFVAGFTGSEIERIMSKDGIPHDFLPLKTGFSRIDVQMVDAIESSINGIGPLATQEDIDALCEKLQNLQDGDTIVLSGSVPRGAKDNVYGEILRSVSHKDLYVVVDAKRPLLLRTLKYRPFLIKPNMQEMTDIFFQDMSSVSTDDIVRYMKTLQSMGARNILVSMGSAGALLLTEDGKIYHHSAMKGKVCNTVGCGDSMLAGFLSGFHKNHDMIEAFHLSLAAASANAFHDGRGTYEQIMRLNSILQNESADVFTVAEQDA